MFNIPIGPCKELIILFLNPLHIIVAPLVILKGVIKAWNAFLTLIHLTNFWPVPSHFILLPRLAISLIILELN